MASFFLTSSRGARGSAPSDSTSQHTRWLSLDQSFALLADPEFRSYLEESIRRLDAKEPAPLLTRDEFLAQTKVLEE